MQQVPNFGFVVFDSTQAVEKALAAKPILLYDNHRLNVEEKKMRHHRRTNRNHNMNKLVGGALLQ